MLGGAPKMRRRARGPRPQEVFRILCSALGESRGRDAIGGTSVSGFRFWRKDDAARCRCDITHLEQHVASVIA
jgi:hypothetical protein